jgi:hypothetical protein
MELVDTVDGFAGREIGILSERIGGREVGQECACTDRDKLGDGE